MGAVKAQANSSESGAIFRRHSREDIFSLSEWRTGLREVWGSLLREEISENHPWFNVAGSTFLETEDVVGLLKPAYTIKNELEIRTWLERYPGARHVLLLAPSLIEVFFPDAGLRLEVRADPEADDRRLGIYIRSPLDSAEAVGQFTAFDSEWGEHLHSITDGRLLFNIEPKS